MFLFLFFFPLTWLNHVNNFITLNLPWWRNGVASEAGILKYPFINQLLGTMVLTDLGVETRPCEKVNNYHVSRHFRDPVARRRLARLRVSRLFQMQTRILKQQAPMQPGIHKKELFLIDWQCMLFHLARFAINSLAKLHTYLKTCMLFYNSAMYTQQWRP